MNIRRSLLATLPLFLTLLTVSTGAESKIKNVLFLISDDLKASTLGAYGDQVVQTPNIDALARQGMVFQRGYCQGTTCGPSRRSFMRSRYQDEDGITMGQNFIENGFYSARVGKIFHMRVPGDIVAGTDGLDVPECWTESFNSPGLEAHTAGLYSLYNHDIETTSMKDRASTAEDHRWFVSVKYEGDGSDQPDFKTASKAIELIREHGKSDKPFFIAAGFVRPHYPNVAPSQYFDLYPPEDITLPETREGDLDDMPEMGYTRVTSLTDPIGKYPENQRKFWGSYYATITYMDDQVGRVMAELDRQGLRESTAVVFIGDHGYHLGEHFFWQKSNLHEDVTRIPFIISAPGYAPGESMSFAELADIYPTVSELVGVSVPDTVQGKSLVPLLKNPAASVRDESFTVGNNQDFAIRGAEWAYMLYKDDTDELYDMKKDPKQFTNLAQNPVYAKVVAAQRKQLVSRIKAAGLNRPLPSPLKGDA
ncbi:MAG: sulfatase [Opitutaceae bacterium]|jgi:iduronate 2-sulfatase|nr:sulfatase [Opitutaceae bacterium]